jgi:hypothetical protein
MHRLTKLLTCTLAACLPVLSLTLGYSPAAGASTSPAHNRAEALAMARAALQHLSVGQHATDHAVAGHELRLAGTTDVSSTNWSGYADLDESFTQVSGTWSEPTVTCSGLGLTEQLAAFWVGIDGYGSDSVEQDGTLAECYLGSIYHYTWWEMYPTNDIQVVGESVSPGDSITASVVRSGDSYTLNVTDSTHTANSFSTTQSCSDCANATAEWIAEAPSSTFGVEPLADFHSWTASGAAVGTTAGSGVISSYPNDNITMIDSLSRDKATTSPLNGSGNGFTVTWVRSS